MPLYEYECSDCEARFEALRAMSAADEAIACPKCEGENTHRVLSLFSAIGGEGVIAGSGASCSSCTSSSCATCSLRES